MEFKAQVLAECEVPGASVAKVAMSHGINTNVVHGWRKLARQARAVANTARRKRPGITPPHQRVDYAVRLGCQRCGNSSSIRAAGCVGSLVSTSLM